jgi:hypothetical protein
MNEIQIKSLIKLTNFKHHADEVFDSPVNTLEMIRRIAEDYAVCVEYQARLYDGGCFNSPERMKEFEAVEIQMGLYKLILAELPKYL